jgi:hypothetical protein
MLCIASALVLSPAFCSMSKWFLARRHDLFLTRGRSRSLQRHDALRAPAGSGIYHGGGLQAAMLSKCSELMGSGSFRVLSVCESGALLTTTGGAMAAILTHVRVD